MSKEVTVWIQVHAEQDIWSYMLRAHNASFIYLNTRECVSFANTYSLGLAVRSTGLWTSLCRDLPSCGRSRRGQLQRGSIGHTPPCKTLDWSFYNRPRKLLAKGNASNRRCYRPARDHIGRICIQHASAISINYNYLYIFQNQTLQKGMWWL